MPAATDFRGHAFDKVRVDAAGRNVGTRVYWKLYAIENLVRVVVHSVLTAQVNAAWWNTSVDPVLRKNVEGVMKGYAHRPWHSTPGKHEIYYTFMPDLVKIIAANSNLFRPIIKDID